MSYVIRATVMQTPAADRLQVIEDALISVDDAGVITAVEAASSENGARLLRTGGDLIATPPGAVLIPGLVDLHVHAPQWPQLGTGLDLPLERWLFEYTFPLEARYADLAFARPIWADLVDGLLRHGTTTASYFATVDVDATSTLAQAAADAGQRAFVGRVAMDHPDGTPDWYRDASAADGVRASARSIDEIDAIDAGRGLVRPIVTPRFTPACTDELLRGLGELAARTGTLVQTHVSESDWAHGAALERFGTTDSEALDAFGLLREGTVLAHANHVTDADDGLIRAHGAGHRPLPAQQRLLRERRAARPPPRSTAGSGSAWARTSRAAPRRASSTRSMRRSRSRGSWPTAWTGRRPAPTAAWPGSAIDTTLAFWLATRGGAEVLGIPAGLLAPGYRFDAVLIDTASRRGSLRVWPALDTPERTFEKIVRLASPTDIVGVWVDGRRVVESSGPDAPYR